MRNRLSTKVAVAAASLVAAGASGADVAVANSAQQKPVLVRQASTLLKDKTSGHTYRATLMLTRNVVATGKWNLTIKSVLSTDSHRAQPQGKPVNVGYLVVYRLAPGVKTPSAKDTVAAEFDMTNALKDTHENTREEGVVTQEKAVALTPGTYWAYGLIFESYDQKKETVFGDIHTEVFTVPGRTAEPGIPELPSLGLFA